jgi:outer membrane receptor protein involved in Fe transport
MTTNKHPISRAAGLSLAILAAFGGTGLVISTESQAQAITEIIVTARRKEENLKEVPLSITAFDSAQIESAGITSLGDVADLTPGLSFFNAFGENLPVPVIRGIVPQDIFGENATAIFVDGVYVSGREGLNFSQLDLERIEVLKGPQSAMYGRNAFAGAINYVTKAPPDMFEAKSEVEGGNRGKQRVMGQVGGPILGEALTGRISAMYDEWDGSYDNTLAGGDDIGGYRYRSLQGRLRWRPLDTLEVNLGLYSSNDEIDESAVGGVPANCEDQVEQRTTDVENGPFPRLQNWCGRIPDLAALPDALDPNFFDSSQLPYLVVLPNSITKDSMPHNPAALGEDRDLTRGNLGIAWDLDFGTINFLTGYSDTEQSSVSDFNRSSGVSLPLIYCLEGNTAGPVPVCTDSANNFPYARAPMGWINIENGGETEEWSQEVRFTSQQDQQLRYALGAYYFNVNVDAFPGNPVATTQIPADYTTIGVGPIASGGLAIGSYIFGGSVLPGGAIDPLSRIIANEEEEGWSVFGSMDYDFGPTEQWTAGAEIRYSQDTKDITTYDYEPCGNPDVLPFNTDTCDPDITGDPVYDLRVTAPCVRVYYSASTIGPGEVYDPDREGDYLRCDPGTQSGSTRFSSVTGRLSLKYKFDSGWTGYGSVAWGEKPGGLQIFDATVITGTSTSSELVTNSFDPEKITTYELGIKGFTADQRIGLDMAVFYYDWTDIVFRQLQETSPASGLQFEQPTSLNVNAGDSEVWGWEMSADIGLTDNLTGRVTGSWTDSTLTDARMDTYALFPSFYTSDPSCAPEAIQALDDPTPDEDNGNEAQNAKAGECRQLSGDVSGNTQMRQPEWTASGSLTYEHELTGDWQWNARVDANYLGKIYVGNDNQTWLPARTNVNFRLGFDSARYSVEFWVRNLFENNNPIAAFRDIYWTNDSDIQGIESQPNVSSASNFDDFPPLRMSITYPSLRTYGVVGKVRFGGAEE